MATEEFETFQSQALEVNEPDEDFDPQAPIEDGDQFLTHMLHERRQHPTVMVRPFHSKEEATVSSNIVPPDAIFQLLGDHCEVIEGFRKTEGWKKAIDKQFNNARKVIADARLVSTEENLDMVDIPMSNDASEWIAFFKQYEPKVDIVIRFKQRSIENIIEYLCDWLHNRFYDDKKPEEPTDSVDESYNTAASKSDMRNTTCENESCSSLNYVTEKYKNLHNNFIDLVDKDSWFGQWSYAAFAATDGRVGPDLIGTVREMARLLILYRHRMDPSNEAAATPYSLLIHLIVQVFRQLDLGAFV